MNTLAMTDKLKAAGVSDKEARAHVEVVLDSTDELVTTDELDARINELEARLRVMMAEQTAALSRSQITTIVAMTAIFTMVSKFL